MISWLRSGLLETQINVLSIKICIYVYNVDFDGTYPCEKMFHTYTLRCVIVTALKIVLSVQLDDLTI